jgi:hypothetical protein
MVAFVLKLTDAEPVLESSVELIFDPDFGLEVAEGRFNPFEFGEELDFFLLVQMLSAFSLLLQMFESSLQVILFHLYYHSNPFISYY